MQVAEAEHVKTKGNGGVILYLTVDDVKTTSEVSFPNPTFCVSWARETGSRRRMC